MNLHVDRALRDAVSELIDELLCHARLGLLTAQHLRAVFYATRRPFPDTRIEPTQHETWFAVLGIPQGRVRIAGHRPLRPEHLPGLPVTLRILGLAPGTDLTPAADLQTWIRAVGRAIADLHRPLAEDEARFPDPAGGG